MPLAVQAIGLGPGSSNLGYRLGSGTGSAVLRLLELGADSRKCGLELFDLIAKLIRLFTK